MFKVPSPIPSGISLLLLLLLRGSEGSEYPEGKRLHRCFWGFGSVKMEHFLPSAQSRTVTREENGPHMNYKSGLRRTIMPHYRIENTGIFHYFERQESMIIWIWRELGCYFMMFVPDKSVLFVSSILIWVLTRRVIIIIIDHSEDREIQSVLDVWLLTKIHPHFVLFVSSNPIQ